MEDQNMLPDSPPKSPKENEFVVEKDSTNGLPPGWIKETRVRKQFWMVVKHSFYTDPVSGYVFRSLKDVHRYLETGVIGRLAYKPKDNVGELERFADKPKEKDEDHVDVELGDDKLASGVEKSSRNELPLIAWIRKTRARKHGPMSRKDASLVEKASTNELPPGRIKKTRARKPGPMSRKDAFVVEKASTNNLPPGWIKKTRARKKGPISKKDAYYIDPVDGYIFRSLKEVHRYLETGVGRLANKTKDKKRVNGEFDNELASVVEKASTNELPPGLIKKTRARKHGPIPRKDASVVEKASTNELPPGWIKKTRARKKGPIWRKDAYYIDPVYGYIFRSLKEVHRYLETGENGRLPNKTKDKKRVNVGLDDDKLPCKVEKASTNKLPPGWIKKTRARKHGPMSRKDACVVEKASTNEPPPGRIKKTRARKHGPMPRKDAYYIDPVDGYIFRSMKEVHRYLETGGRIGRLPNKQKDKKRANVEFHDDKLPSPAIADDEITKESGTSVHIIESRNLKLADNTTKGEPILQSICTADQHLEKLPLENGVEKQLEKRKSELPRRASKRIAGKIDQKRALKRSNQTRELTPIQSDEPETSSVIKLPLENEVVEKQQEERKSELPRRASKRLAGKMDQKRALKRTNRTQELAPIQSNEAETSSVITSVKSFTDLTNLDGKTEKEVTENTTHDSQEHAGQAETDDTPLNLSLTDLWNDPCIEFAVKTLTGAIPIGDEIKDNKVVENPESSLDNSLKDLWTDPCIEFAVKTLTGAIPVVGDYFQRNISSSQTLEGNSFSWSNSRIDNFCHTDLVSKHFDTAAEKPALYEKRNQMAAGNECSRPTVI